MAQSFANPSIYRVKPTFGNLINSNDSSDYLQNKKAKLLYSKNYNRKSKTGSLGSNSNYLLFQKAQQIRDTQVCQTASILDPNQLISNLYSTEVLKNVNVVTSATANVTCGTLSPANVTLAKYTSGNPFYFFYNIDTCSLLFGSSPCGYNNYTYFRVFTKPTINTSTSLVNCNPECFPDNEYLSICEKVCASYAVYGYQINSPWPHFGGVFNNNAGLAQNSASQNGNLKWSANTSGAFGQSSPAISSDGTVYVGSSLGFISFNGSTGAINWVFSSTSSFSSSPAISVNGNIFVGSDDGNLYSISSNGSFVWNFTIGSPVSSSPTIYENTIYVGADNNTLYAITQTGALKWSCLLSATGNIYSSASVGSDGTIYVTSTDSNLYAVRPNGTLKWSFATSGQITSSPSIGSNGTIYVTSTDKNLYAVSPGGTLKWTYPTNATINCTPAIDSNGNIYFGASNGNLYSVSPTGNLNWVYNTSAVAIISSLAIGLDNTIYFGSYDSNANIYAVGKNGNLKWVYPTNGAFYSAPAIGSDGTIYIGNVGNISSTFYAIN